MKRKLSDDTTPELALRVERLEPAKPKPDQAQWLPVPLRRDGAKHTKHGLTKTAEYVCWNHMLARCCNPNSKYFIDYGARGIRVCAQWRFFPQFLTDMGRKPTAKHTIERRDNNGNYEPSNCTWATNQEQFVNKRTSKFLDFNGERLTLSQWANRLGVPRGYISSRLRRSFGIVGTLTEPFKKRNQKITFNGQSMTRAQWAIQNGLTTDTITQRLNKGWSVEKALTTPKRRTRRG